MAGTRGGREIGQLVLERERVLRYHESNITKLHNLGINSYYQVIKNVERAPFFAPFDIRGICRLSLLQLVQTNPGQSVELNKVLLQARILSAPEVP